MLWIALTIAAAPLQVARTARPRGPRAEAGPWGGTLVRFLFGLPLAVTGFNRYPKLAEALVRRLLKVLFSMYFDAATMHARAATASDARRPVAEPMVVAAEPVVAAHPKVQRQGLGETPGRGRREALAKVEVKLVVRVVP